MVGCMLKNQNKLRLNSHTKNLSLSIVKIAHISMIEIKRKGVNRNDFVCFLFSFKLSKFSFFFLQLLSPRHDILFQVFYFSHCKQLFTSYFFFSLIAAFFVFFRLLSRIYNNKNNTNNNNNKSLTMWQTFWCINNCNIPLFHYFHLLSTVISMQ